MIAYDELAGIVYDGSGKPLEGVLVDAFRNYPRQKVKTDETGKFRLKRLQPDRLIYIRLTKEGYSSKQMVKETGINDIIVRLGNKTYFEGSVLAPDGKPVANALIRAKQGIIRPDGTESGFLNTDTYSTKDGSYRLHVEADTYDIAVRVPDTGIAQLYEQAISKDQVVRLDITLKPGVTFRAKVLNSRTKKPVKNFKLHNDWRYPGVDGVSDSNGIVKIENMFPGPFSFNVEADGIARWWSEDSLNKYKQRLMSKNGWQRNFDNLEFAIAYDMMPVLIEAEDGVKITGKVLDPDGNTVAGATVTPALTGTGNSITGNAGVQCAFGCRRQFRDMAACERRC